MVLKPMLGSFGLGVRLISQSELYDGKKTGLFYGKEYISEEHLKQSSILSAINPYSVNTIRIITLLCPNGEVEFLAAILRSSQSKIPVDNFTMRGIVVGIELENGKLKKEGFARYIFPSGYDDMDFPGDPKTAAKTLMTMKKRGLLRPGKVLLKHPVTKIEFHGYQLPHWEKLKEIAINAQKAFCHLKSIGWDIAITDEGPVIIEGNQNWGTTGLQTANGGLLTVKNIRLFSQYGISFY
jgi:hypothetical protein